MDFLLYQNLKAGEFDYTKLNIDLCTDQIVYYGHKFVVAWRPSTINIVDEHSVFLMSGRVQYKKEGTNTSAKFLGKHLESDRWPLDDNFTGCFSGVMFKEDTIRIFTDPIGLFHLYYSFSDQYIIVASNLNAIHSIIDAQINKSAVLLEMTSPEFSQYGRSTVLKNVYTLMPGELLVCNDGKIRRLFDTTIKIDDKPGTKNLHDEFVDLINAEFKDFYSDQETLILSMSGGVDSRVNFAGLLANGKKPHMSNFGKPEYIDSKIPNKIARDLNLPIDIIDPTGHLFPPQAVINEVVKETDSLYVNQWLALIEFYKNQSSVYPLFLLGDMCDIFRSKGIYSLKTRKFRQSHYIRKFFTGRDLSLIPLDEQKKRNFTVKQRDIIITSVKSISTNFLKNSVNNELIADIEADLYELFEHLDRYNPSYMESFEELFGIFTHGRRSMGKQLNILKMIFTPEIPVLNLRILRHVLNYSPAARYSDELTNRMFRNPAWCVPGNYPTAQNPFLSYNSNFWLMMLGWYFRSSADQVLLKLSVATKGKFKRQRVVKSRDILSEYQFPGARENFFGSLTGSGIDASKLLQLFDDRSERHTWPLSGQDLVPYAQAAWYLTHFRN